MNLTIDPTPQFDLSPNLYMQFMEPLGTTDSSVEAAWDFFENAWRPDFIEVIQKLNPGCIRWGGIYSSFWKWREGVGPRDRRVPALNYLWGGSETNQVGLHEIIDLCNLADAEPLMAINFAADGRPRYFPRAGDETEAADLVSYCNDPEHAERRANGAQEPWNIRLWQIGNETSYPEAGKRFNSEQNATKFAKFAEAMRSRDPSIELIGWGDQERDTGKWWAPDLLKVAGEHVDYVAIHMMMQRPQSPVFLSRNYAKDYDRTWDELGKIFHQVEKKLTTCIDILDASTAKIAITRGHLSLSPHNINPLLYEWLSGLYHGRIMTLYERHGAKVEVATLADFFGTRWTVNAVMLGGPNQSVFLMPAGIIAQFFHEHSGSKGLTVPASVGSLDLSASRNGDEIFLHVVNTDLHTSQILEINIDETPISSAKAIEIAPSDVAAYVDHQHTNRFAPAERVIEPVENHIEVSVPAASVSVIVMTIGHDHDDS